MGLLLFDTLILLLFIGFAGYLVGYWLRRLYNNSRKSGVLSKKPKVKKSKINKKYKYRYLRSIDGDKQKAPKPDEKIFKYRYLKKDSANYEIKANNADEIIFKYRYLKKDSVDFEIKANNAGDKVAKISTISDNNYKYRYLKEDVADDEATQDNECITLINITEVKRHHDSNYKYRYLKADKA